MSDQSPSNSDLTNCSVTGDDNVIGSKPIITFKWTPKLEKCVLRNMTRLKPCGINKHLSILLIKEKISEQLQLDIPIKVLWNYVSSKWNIEAADMIEGISFDTSEKDFVLPEDFVQLMAEEGEKIEKPKNECLKERFNDVNHSKLSECSPAKTSEFGSDDGPCTSRSLRSYNNLDSNESDAKKNSKDLNELHEKTSNQSENEEKIENTSNLRDVRAADMIERISFDTSEKDFEVPGDFVQLMAEEGEKIEKPKNECLNERFKDENLSKLSDSSPTKTSEFRSDDGPCTSRSLRSYNKIENIKSKDMKNIEKISNLRGRKGKSRNVSESSFFSDNSKQCNDYKNYLTDLTFSDSFSRSVTPEILRGKTSNISFSFETIRGIPNLCSSDKNKKSTLALEKACPKVGHTEIKIEKPEKQLVSLIKAKSKNEAINKVKAKMGNKITSDLLIVKQFPYIQSLGRRSCNRHNKLS